MLAGGQSLVPMLNFRLARPAVLVDINQVADLDGIRAEDGTLRIGATSRQRALERHLSRAADGPETLLRSALGYIGHPQIRARGTVGGSLAHADPAAELPAAVCALGATLVIRERRRITRGPRRRLLRGLLHHRPSPPTSCSPRSASRPGRGAPQLLPRGQPSPRRLRAGRRWPPVVDRGRRPGDPGRARRCRCRARAPCWRDGVVDGLVGLRARRGRHRRAAGTSRPTSTRPGHARPGRVPAPPDPAPAAAAIAERPAAGPCDHRPPDPCPRPTRVHLGHATRTDEQAGRRRETADGRRGARDGRPRRHAGDDHA